MIWFLCNSACSLRGHGIYTCLWISIVGCGLPIIKPVHASVNHILVGLPACFMALYSDRQKFSRGSFSWYRYKAGLPLLILQGAIVHQTPVQCIRAGQAILPWSLGNLRPSSHPTLKYTYFISPHISGLISSFTEQSSPCGSFLLDSEACRMAVHSWSQRAWVLLWRDVKLFSEVLWREGERSQHHL